MSTRIHKANSYRTFLPATEIIREIGCTFEFQDSVVLCDHIRVLDLDRIRYKIGRVSDTAIAGVVLLGLSFVFGIR